MSVKIASQSIETPADLDRAHLAVLSLIPSALSWLDWAMADQSGHFSFSNGDELITSVLEGIHGTTLLPLKGPDLWLHPLVLTTMNLDDLIIIVKSQNEGRPVSGLKKVLQQYGLHNSKTLAAAATLPQRLGVDNSPCFSTLTPDDRLRLADLDAVCRPDDADWRNAASFAAGEALHVRDFVSYTEFQRLCGDGDARVVPAALTPHLWSWLRGPAALTTDEATVTETVTNYLQKGGVLGFNDQATALRYLAAHVPLLSLRPPDMLSACAKAVQEVNGAAASFQADSVHLSQDGQTRRYTMQTNGLTLERNQGGVLTILDYPS